MRFSYYRRLEGWQKKIYRASDEYGSIELDDPKALRPIAAAIGDALGGDDRIAVERGSHRLVAMICRQMGVGPVSVRVQAERPRSLSAELHGLYVREEDERPVIFVWMRTAAHSRPVAHKTYLRTLMHEVCHHLDYELLDLEESFHTHGFFQRESSLIRQLLPRRRGRRATTSTREAAPAPSPGPPAVEPAQLELPI